MAFQTQFLKKALREANSKALHGFSRPTFCASFSSIPSSYAAMGADESKPVLPPFDYEPRPYKGPLTDEIFQKRKKFLGPSLFHYYQKPLNIVEGKMQYLFDENGRRYLDAFAGIVTVSCGHCHPDVLAAVNEQNKLLQHATTIYLHHGIADFAEALAEKMPGNLKKLMDDNEAKHAVHVVYFVNSGTEANELAMLMARLYSGNLGMIALRNAYHGGSSNTIGLTALNTWKYPIPQGEIHHVVNPDPYRGVFGSDASGYVKDVQEHIDYGTSGKVAGFIAETIQGVGGAVELAPGYLKHVYDIVRNAGGVCIADEVQTGFGRTGSHYWGFETQGVIPDIVTMAKGIGNGLPLGAVVTTPEIASTMAQKIQFNTFGGNPVCSAVGTCSSKRDVRGRGLMVGVELVTDRKEKTPAKTETAVLFEKLRDFLVDALDYSISKL
ncbi:hypothetical protein Csa_014732 [Cucumis sativus]|nr:hypothetical protein Csa_014732 [Cucumis sativus]